MLTERCPEGLLLLLLLLLLVVAVEQVRSGGGVCWLWDCGGAGWVEMPQRARGELSRLAKRLAAQGQLLPKWNIVTGDKVAVLAGKEKGKQGVVTKVVRRENRLFVKGLNFHKKSVKMRDQENPGGILEREAPIHYSNVQLLDPSTVTSEWPVQPGVPTRFHIGWDSTGRQVRVAKRSGLVIEKPAQEPKLKSYTGTCLRCDARTLA